MSEFEHVSVLLSIVVSLAFTHLLTGIAGMIRMGGSRLSFVHAGWVAVLLFACIDYWFSIWGLLPLVCSPGSGPKHVLEPAPTEELRHGPEETFARGDHRKAA